MALLIGPCLPTGLIVRMLRDCFLISLLEVGRGGGGEEEERGPSCGMLTVTVFEVLTGGNVATVDD